MDYVEAISKITVHNNSSINGNFKKAPEVSAQDLDSTLSSIKGFPDKKLLAAKDYILAKNRTKASLNRTPKDYYALYEKDIEAKNYRAEQMLSKFSKASRV